MPKAKPSTVAEAMENDNKTLKWDGKSIELTGDDFDYWIE
jgi:hypothetical protein